MGKSLNPVKNDFSLFLGQAFFRILHLTIPFNQLKVLLFLLDEAANCYFYITFIMIQH